MGYWGQVLGSHCQGALCVIDKFFGKPIGMRAGAIVHCCGCR